MRLRRIAIFSGAVFIALGLTLAAGPATQPSGPSTQPSQENASVPPVFRFTMNSLAGKPVDLSIYQGKVVLMVNTASKCGYTPQYAGLQKLHEKYKDRGLALLGFPANDFGHQEPGTDQEISKFCSSHFGVT